MRLREISPEVYARQVLPLTASLWAGERSFDQYVRHTLEIARSRYGRRSYRTIGLYEGRTVVASFKRYERMLHHGEQPLRALGFGAVFTRSEYRGRGYASMMLGAALDDARHAGYELVFLFSDIRPQFYAAIGFRSLSSRRFSLRAAVLPATRLELANVTETHWPALRRLFDRCERRREAGLLRSREVWEWVALRARHAREHPIGDPINLVAKRGRRIVAYVLGSRRPETDAYVLDEFAFADGHAEIVPALFRAAAGDLRRITGWLPPETARCALPRISVRERRRPIPMIAPLTPRGNRLFEALARSRDELCFRSDHI